MPINFIESGDFVNEGRDKVNDALGEIPVLFAVSVDGNMIITKSNGDQIVVPLKNFFALLPKVAQMAGLAMATPDDAGKVQLVDDNKPDQLKSSQRVLTASQVVNLIADAVKNLSPTTGNETPAPTPTLDQVTAEGERTTHNLIVSEGSNFVRELATAAAQGGYYFWLKDLHTILGGIINLDADQIALFNRYVAFALNGHDALLNADRLLMPNTALSLATIQRTQKPAATNSCNGLWGPQADSATGQSKDVLFSAAQVFSLIRAELDEYVLQRNLGGKPSSPGPVGTIYCRPTPTTPTTPTGSGSGITEKFFSVTAAQLGTLRTHGLNVAGSQIWPILLGPDNRDASNYISLTFPDNNSFTVTADNPETAADSSFSLKINLRVIPQ